MITGLKLDFTVDELKAQLDERITYHQNKANWYREKVVGLRDGGIRPEAVTNDPVSSLEHSGLNHQQKADFFDVIRLHLVPGETYRLDENDLARLEFISRYL